MDILLRATTTTNVIPVLSEDPNNHVIVSTQVDDIITLVVVHNNEQLSELQISNGLLATGFRLVISIVRDHWAGLIILIR